MTPLSEVAADVAQALELKGHWSHEERPRFLMEDGSNITEDYWRCRCEDWLIAQGWSFSCDAGPELVHEAWQWLSASHGAAHVKCPWSEAPARLVSAVRRKQQEGKP